MDQNWNKLEKACSRSNFEKRFGAINSWEPKEFNFWAHIIRKKIENFFCDPFDVEVNRQTETADKTDSLW